MDFDSAGAGKAVERDIAFDPRSNASSAPISLARGRAMTVAGANRALAFVDGDGAPSE